MAQQHNYSIEKVGDKWVVKEPNVNPSGGALLVWELKAPEGQGYQAMLQFTELGLVQNHGGANRLNDDWQAEIIDAGPNHALRLNLKAGIKDGLEFYYAVMIVGENINPGGHGLAKNCVWAIGDNPPPKIST